MIALPWLATLLTRDPFMIALVAVAGRAPWFLFSLPAGVWTDRFDRKSLMLRADIIRCGLTLCIIGIALSMPSDPQGSATILLLAFLAFLLGTAEVFRDNAAQTVLPSLVDKSDLERANGQLWSAEQLTNQFIGPPLAGLLIAVGIALPFSVDAATFALSAGLIWMIALPPRPAAPNPGFWHAFVEGWAWMKSHRTILSLAIMLGCLNAAHFGAFAMLVLYAQEVLDLGPTAYGLMMTFGALGAVVGSLGAPVVLKHVSREIGILLALGVIATASLIMGLTSSIPLTALSVFGQFTGGMFWNVITVSYRQRAIPDDLLGRVNAIYRFFGWGAIPIGTALIGALITWAETPLGRDAALHLPYLICAGVCVGLMVFAKARLKF